MIPVRLRRSVPAALFLVSMALGPAHAAENSLAKGQWAFEFAAELFNSDAASFIVRRHFSDRSALQLDAYVAVSGADDNGTGLEFDLPDTVFEVDSGTSHGHRVQFGASYVFYPKTEGKALLFLSGGGYYLHSNSSENSAFTANGGSLSRVGFRDFDSKAWGVGTTARIGFDWFFSSRLSLGSRYGATLEYTHHTFDHVDQFIDSDGSGFGRTNHDVEKRVTFSMTQLQIGISFYP